MSLEDGSTVSVDLVMGALGRAPKLEERYASISACRFFAAPSARLCILRTEPLAAPARAGKFIILLPLVLARCEQGLGLELAGVELDSKGALKVDQWQQTSAASVYALGDCTDTPQLTPVALAEGHCFADTQFGGHSR